MTGTSAKVLACLREAGGDGLSSAELAERFYGRSGSMEQGRVSMLIGALRRKGHTIATIIVFSGKVRLGRYVLYEPPKRGAR